MHKLTSSLLGSLWGVLIFGAAASAQTGQRYLQLDGINDFVQVQDPANDFSVVSPLDPDRRGLTVSAWIRPDTLTFPTAQGSGYIHWLGKGQGSGSSGQQEWVFRMYNQQTTDTPPRPNRISFYVFNLNVPSGQNLGVGSFFQDTVRPGQWIHVVGVVDNELTRTYIYKNGKLRDCDQYGGRPDGEIITLEDGTRIVCRTDPLTITPAAGNAPLRMGTRDRGSFLQGSLGEVRVWTRPLTREEVADLYALNSVPQDRLVAEYLLDEDTGTTAVDSVGAHHGEIRDGNDAGATWERRCLEGPQRVCAP